MLDFTTCLFVWMEQKRRPRYQNGNNVVVSSGVGNGAIDRSSGPGNARVPFVIRPRGNKGNAERMRRTGVERRLTGTGTCRTVQRLDESVLVEC